MKTLRPAICLLVCALLAACAGPRTAPKFPPTEPALFTLAPTNQVPLINGGNLEWRVRATLDGEEGEFALDTGADATVLSTAFARKLGQHCRRAHVKVLSLGRNDYFDFQAPVLDLRHIDRANRSDLAGILGNNILKQCACSINWRSNLMTLEAPVKEPPPEAIPVTVRDNRIFLTATINGQPAEFALDTGAYRSLLAQSEVARLAIPTNRLSRVEALQIDITATQRVPQTLVRLDSFQVGSREWRDCSLLTWTHSVVGMDLLQDGILEFDLRRNWIALKP